MDFNSILLINVSVFMPIPRCFNYCGSILVLEVRDGDDFRSSFIVNDSFRNPKFFGLFLFVFPYEVEYCSFKVCEELCCDI